MKALWIFLLISALLLTGCAPAIQTDSNTPAQSTPPAQDTPPPAPPSAEPKPGTGISHDIHNPGHVVYLAGGCFWGLQKYLQTIPGVIKTTTGYANGEWTQERALGYEDVVAGNTGFRETVYVEYDPEKVSLDTILFAYFYVIDPTVTDRQGPDIGSQYQTGVYYTNDFTKETVDRIAEIERERYPSFLVEIEPLEVFYEAEEEHQHYLDKNPDGYCHIANGQIHWMNQIIVDPANYKRPDMSTLQDILTPLQYQVTQENYTEEPFNNEFWDFFEKGIYVDIVSGEPLFSSLDKFESPCGWAAFSKGIDVNTFFFTVDYLAGYPRIEVRSRAANSHLGHLFEGEPTSPTGNRFCINSAALRFIPYEDMDAEGYGYLKFLFGSEDGPTYTVITPREANAMMARGGVTVVDVREENEYLEGHIPGAVLLPSSTLSEDTAAEIIPDKDDTVLLYCRSGNRSKAAAAKLVELGYTNVYEFGGILDWPYEIITE